MTYRTKGEKMRLNLFLTSMGHHEGAWRHPASAVESVQDFRLYQEIAAKAERAKFDSIFMANRYSVSTKAVTYGELGGGGWNRSSFCPRWQLLRRKSA